jgi:hypothetical protein
VTHVARVAVLVSLAACAKGDTRSNADSSAGTSAVQNAPQALVGQQRTAAPGDLTKPLAQYTGDELFALVSSLQYTGGVTRTRGCRNLPGCGGGNPTRNTQVNVEAIATEDSIGGGNVGPYGTIVARGRNIGGAPEALYGMMPGNRYQYFLVILPDSGGTNGWQIEQLEIVGNTRTHASLVNGRVRGCGHPFVRGARTDFRTCAQPPLIRPALFVQPAIDPPWWYTCPDGCCIAS